MVSCVIHYFVASAEEHEGFSDYERWCGAVGMERLFD